MKVTTRPKQPLQVGIHPPPPQSAHPVHHNGRGRPTPSKQPLATAQSQAGVSVSPGGRTRICSTGWGRGARPSCFPPCASSGDLGERSGPSEEPVVRDVKQTTQQNTTTMSHTHARVRGWRGGHATRVLSSRKHTLSIPASARMSTSRCDKKANKKRVEQSIVIVPSRSVAPTT